MIVLRPATKNLIDIHKITNNTKKGGITRWYITPCLKIECLCTFVLKTKFLVCYDYLCFASLRYKTTIQDNPRLIWSEFINRERSHSVHIQITLILWHQWLWHTVNGKEKEQLRHFWAIDQTTKPNVMSDRIPAVGQRYEINTNWRRPKKKWSSSALKKFTTSTATHFSKSRAWTAGWS